MTNVTIDKIKLSQDDVVAWALLKGHNDGEFRLRNGRLSKAVGYVQGIVEQHDISPTDLPGVMDQYIDGPGKAQYQEALRVIGNIVDLWK